MKIINFILNKSKWHLLLGLMLMISSEILITLDPMAFEPKRLYIYLFTVVPGFFIFFIWLFSSSKKVNKIITVICMIIFIVGLLMECIGLGWETSGPFYNIKYYNEILKECNYPDSPKVKHFPTEIPHNAYNVKMVYRRGFLQGDKSLKLSMCLDDIEFDNLLKRNNIDKKDLFKEKKDISFDEVLEKKGQSKISDYWQYITFRTNNYNNYPDDFYFKKGLAVSLARKEFVYWY